MSVVYFLYAHFFSMLDAIATSCLYSIRKSIQFRIQLFIKLSFGKIERMAAVSSAFEQVRHILDKVDTMRITNRPLQLHHMETSQTHLINNNKVQLSGKQSAGTGENNGDVAWWPQLPPGHTPYTWGVENHSVQNIIKPENTQDVPHTQPQKHFKGVHEQNTSKNTQHTQQEKHKKQQQSSTKATKIDNSMNPDITRIDIRVGQVVKAFKHPDADTLYVEEIDIGEAEPRTICSGLVNFIPLEEFQKSRLLVICNLKPVKMRGILSNGMVLAASNDDHTKVELVEPPEGSKPGDRIVVDGIDFAQCQPDAQVDAKKDNTPWARIKPLLRTDAQRFATFDGKFLIVKDVGPARTPTLVHAQLS